MTDFDFRNRWLTLKEAAQYTGYSVSTLRRFAHSKRLQSASVPSRNRSFRFRIEWLDAFICGGDEKKIIAVQRTKRPVKVPQKMKNDYPKFAEAVEKKMRKRERELAEERARQLAESKKKPKR